MGESEAIMVMSSLVSVYDRCLMGWDGGCSKNGVWNLDNLSSEMEVLMWTVVFSRLTVGID